MMTIAQIMEKMIAFSEGNIHDITHLSCVWTYAKTIGELEGLDADTQFILEVAAITHDIACQLCRKKNGNTNNRRHIKDFCDRKLKIKVMNNGQIVDNMGDLAEIAARYV